LGEVILQRPEAVRQKPRRRESAFYQHLLRDTDIDLPISGSTDLHRRNIEYVEWPAVKTGYRLLAAEMPGLPVPVFHAHRILGRLEREGRSPPSRDPSKDR